MDVRFVKVVSNEDISRLAKMADTVWHEYFPCILSAEQIDYMVDKFQSEHAMAEQILHGGYEYYFICGGDEYAGYTGFVREKDKMFLSKLYLMDKYRSKGYASRTLRFLKNECGKSGLGSIYLTVNRYNEHTISVYKKWGFVSVREQCTDIGNGYVMDDYVMELGVK